MARMTSSFNSTPELISDAGFVWKQSVKSNPRKLSTPSSIYWCPSGKADSSSALACEKNNKNDKFHFNKGSNRNLMGINYSKLSHNLLVSQMFCTFSTQMKHENLSFGIPKRDYWRKTFQPGCYHSAFFHGFSLCKLANLIINYCF